MRICREERSMATNPGTTPITILAINSDHGLSFAGEETQTMLSEFPFLCRFTVLLNSGGSNSPWSEFWSEFPHCMGMGVVPAPSIWTNTSQDRIFHRTLSAMAHWCIPSSGEIHMDRGPIIGPCLFLGKLVWTNGPESSSRVSPYTGVGPWMALPRFGPVKPEKQKREKLKIQTLRTKQEKGGKMNSGKRYTKFLAATETNTWATPKPSHSKPSHPHVPSWAVFLSEGFRGSVRAIPGQGPATLVLKRRMGVRGNSQGRHDPWEVIFPPKLTSDRPALNMTGFR